MIERVAVDTKATDARLARFEQSSVRTNRRWRCWPFSSSRPDSEDHAASLHVRQAAIAVNWIVWVAFCAGIPRQTELRPRSPHLRQTGVVRSADHRPLATLPRPGDVPGRQGRSGRPRSPVTSLRARRGGCGDGLRQAGHVLGRKKLHYVALATTVVISLGAFGISPSNASLPRAFSRWATRSGGPS